MRSLKQLWNKIPEPTNGQLRTFCITWLLVLGAFFSWTAWRGGHVISIWAWGLVTLSIPLSALVTWKIPHFTFKAMMLLTWPIRTLVLTLLLVTLYYLVITPLGCVLRWRGHDPLRLRTDPGSYWTTPAQREAKDYFRQF